MISLDYLCKSMAIGKKNMFFLLGNSLNTKNEKIHSYSYRLQVYQLQNFHFRGITTIK